MLGTGCSIFRRAGQAMRSITTSGFSCNRAISVSYTHLDVYKRQFRPVAGTRHLHRDYNFTELTVETVSRSLHHACRSELTRQGISLP